MNKKITCEVELDGVICAKQLPVPTQFHFSDPAAREYVRQYFLNLGYVVGSYVRFC